MPIKTTPTGTVDFLQKFDVYTDVELEENINNMFSYNIVPTPTSIQYSIGTTNKTPVVGTLELLNLTQNANLIVDILYNKSMLNINSGASSQLTDSGKYKSTITLPPKQKKQIQILVSNDVSMELMENVNTNMEVIVKFNPNNELIRKASELGPLEKITLPNNIQFV
jgi:hypothetical protein